MEVKVVYSRDSNSFTISWTSSADRHVKLALNPNWVEGSSRVLTTSQISVISALAYLSSKKVTIKYSREAKNRIGALRRWSERMIAKNDLYTDDQIKMEIDRLNISFRPTQIVAIVNLIRNCFNFLIALCGMGKTLAMLSAIQIEKRLFGKVFSVIVAPKASCSQFSQELKAHADRLDLKMVDLTELKNADREYVLNYARADVFLINVESLKKYVPIIIKRLKAQKVRASLWIDEAHMIKNPNGEWHLAIEQIAAYFEKICISTATPAPLGPKDWRSYLKTVWIPKGVESYTDAVPDSDLDLIRNLSYISTEDDLQYAPIKSQYAIYKNQKDLLKICKETVLKEVNNGRKVVLFYVKNDTLLEAYKMFNGVPRTVLSGSYAVEDCHSESLLVGRHEELQKRAKYQFNFDPDCMILFAQYRCGSTGLNLQFSGARLAFCLEITTSGSDLFQSGYRNRRPFVRPPAGFEIIYPLPSDPESQRRVLRQFRKLEVSRNFLMSIYEDVRDVQEATLNRFSKGSV